LGPVEKGTNGEHDSIEVQADQPQDPTAPEPEVTIDCTIAPEPAAVPMEERQLPPQPVGTRRGTSGDNLLDARI
jgi:hypothetical protein